MNRIVLLERLLLTRRYSILQYSEESRKVSWNNSLFQRWCHLVFNYFSLAHFPKYFAVILLKRVRLIACCFWCFQYLWTWNQWKLIHILAYIDICLKMLFLTIARCIFQIRWLYSEVLQRNKVLETFKWYCCWLKSNNIAGRLF